MPYELLIERRAEKDLNKLSSQLLSRRYEGSINPHPEGSRVKTGGVLG